MDLALSGRRALVLGSSSGLGKATAATLTAEGVRVAVTSRAGARSKAAADDIGAEAALTVDLTVAGSAREAVEDAVRAFGGLDICIVNTGGGHPGGIMDTDGSDDAAYRSMLRPALEAARAAAPYLKSSAAGRLVFLTARSILETTPDLALSGVMRSGVAAAARSLAVELAPNVLVNVVATGQFDTPALERFESDKAEREQRTTQAVRHDHVTAIPAGRVGRAEELGDVVTFLCSARASFVNGTVVRVDGGAVRGY